MDRSGAGEFQGHTVELLGSRHSFGALPGVEEELRAVFRGEGRAGGVLEGEVLPDDKFTKSAMLAELARQRPVVHIASHFSFRPGDETRSFSVVGRWECADVDGDEGAARSVCWCGVADVVGVQHGGATGGRRWARDRCVCGVGAAVGSKRSDGDVMAAGRREFAVADAGVL